MSSTRFSLLNETKSIHSSDSGQVVRAGVYRRGCIFRIEKKIFEEEVNPVNFSIGPLHYGVNHLSHGQKLKEKLASEFIARVGKELVSDFRNFLMVNELGLRASYATDVSSENLISIIYNDAMFILEVMLKSRDCPAVNVIEFHKNDLLLLENQIPLFVNLDLWERYQMLRYQRNHRLWTDVIEFVELFSEFFGLKNCKTVSKSSMARKLIEACHLLDLRRLLETQTRESTTKPNTTIEVKTAKNMIDNALGLKLLLLGNLTSYELSCWWLGFSTLNLPQVEINECYWVSRMVNMMEFERRYYQYMEERPVCQFLHILCSLIHHEKDFELMKKSKIILHEKRQHGYIVSKLRNIGGELNISYPDVLEEYGDWLIYPW